MQTQLSALTCAALLLSCVDSHVDWSGAAGAAGAGALGHELPSGGAAPAAGGAAAAGSPGNAAGTTSNPRQPPSSGASWIYTQGRQLLLGRRQQDGSFEAPSPYRMKCVGWSPTGVGERNDAGYTALYTRHAAQDVPLLAAVAANTVKTYSPFEPNGEGLAILDALYERGVMVVMNVMPSIWDAESGAHLRTVEFFRGHPAILMWQLGNELNYNKLYGAASLDEAVAMVVKALGEVHALDPDHPVSVSWGNTPSPHDLARLASVDVWSLNLYPHLAMEPRLESWLAMSQKPMFVGEYGADAYDTKAGAEDEASQAMATRQLTEQIQARSSAAAPNEPAIGGCVFNFSDEWWKGMGTASSHDAGGFDNSGVYPDGVANEEWWGLVTVERTPRQAYTALQTIFSSL